MKWFLTSSIIAHLCLLGYVTGTPTWTMGPTGKYYTNLRQPKKNKEESKQLCEDAGGFLPQPMNSVENDFLKRFASSSHDIFYLGLTDEGIWMWDTCHARVKWFDWIHWSPAVIEPNGGVKENCALFWRHKGWVDDECVMKASTVVCERRNHSWIQGPNAKQYMEMCIPKSDKEKTTQICKDAGGILPQPMNNEENDFVKSLFTGTIFLGMNDIENETRFVWDDGGALVQWFGWDDRIPRQPTGYGDCVMTEESYGWFDIMCTTGVKTVVCERQDRTQDCLRPYFCENNQNLCFKCKKAKQEGKCLLLTMEGTINKPLSYPVHYSEAIDPEVGGFSCSVAIPVKDIVNSSTMMQPQRLKFTMKISESNTTNVLFPMDYVIGLVTDFTSTSTTINRLGTKEKMRCSVKHRQNVANVTSIAISNNGVKVAKITKNESVSSVGNSKVLNVTGSLTSTLEELGFLELTLTDSGNYTCDIKVKDNLGKTTYIINRVLNIERVAETNSDIVDYLLKQKNLQSHGNTTDVFFSVGLSKTNNKRIPSGQVLIFNQIFSAKGGGYDTATGVFTCPVAGFYNLIVHAQTEYSEEVAFHVQHNGRNVFDVSSRDGYAYQDVSNSAILKLKKGDTVRVVSYDDETDVHSTVESVTTTFSGHLISVL